jgi:glycosyltransferase involved in cell wall biosynthesis
MKILALSDSPTLTSGFANVARNLFRRWNAEGAAVDVWGIGFVGWGYRNAPYVEQIFPAAIGQHQWNDLPCLELFLRQLATGGYTHLWLMQDTFMLAVADFPAKLREICQQKKIHSTLYFPVDAPLDAAWTDIIAAVDLPVACTQYGKAEAEAKGRERGHSFTCEVLPHGIDTDVFRPLPNRGKLRETLWTPNWLSPDDFLMLNVNANQRRKDVSRSLEVLKELRRRGVPAKLLMHMPESSREGLSLETVGRQLGLTLLEDWAHHGFAFRRGNAILGEAELVKYYNVADLYLTTTLGEGWGLGATEALACGCPVAAPMHTACREIGDSIDDGPEESRWIGLPTERNGVVLDGDNSRVRHRVAVAEAADAIEGYYKRGRWRERPALNEKAEHWLSWGRIAHAMLRLMRRPVQPLQTSALPAKGVAITPVMITCPGREAMLTQTLAQWGTSDCAAALGLPVVLVDDSTAERKQERQEQNALKALRKGLETDVEFILFLEDDLEFNAHLGHNLARWAPLTRGEFGMAGLYNPNIHAEGAARRRNFAEHWFEADPEGVYGSQAFLFSRACAQFVADHWTEIAGMQDIKMSRLAAKGGWKIFYHTPSLVQHVGKQSAWGGQFHQAADYDPKFKA